ncbi:hypothetical protein AAVH_27687 [Aphelenchoides avenae]|nr:hypothetical protein AAVH_27687 [Aphelenchus avenae]
MLLPNELLLDVLHFADYSTLVAVKLVDTRFLDVVAKFSAELACRHNFQVLFFPSYITYVDVTIGSRRKSIRYESGSQSSLAGACREVAGVIGPHVVAKLLFLENSWTVPGVGVIFEGAPVMKYAEDVGLYSECGSTAGYGCDSFLNNFAGIKSLRLGPNYDVFSQFSWEFLRRETTRDLRLISLNTRLLTEPRSHFTLAQLTENKYRSVEELVRYCAALPHPPSGEALELDLPETFCSEAFVLRIIELLRGAQRELTVRMKTQLDGSGLVLDESYYEAVANNTATRYASTKDGIVVEVKGHPMTIQRTVLAGDAKAKLTMPFVENQS